MEETFTSTVKTAIQEFYSDQTIFITGGTGFVGKVLIEKLLRACYNLRAIYMLVRPKRGETSEKRMEEFFDNALFARLMVERPDSINKLYMMQGDCELPNLGLSSSDRELLRLEVNCVFHVAATVRFNEKLQKATYVNVRATRDLLRLAKQMPKLKSFIHISTAYSFCVNDIIREEVDTVSITANDLIKLVENTNEKQVIAVTPTITEPWPNTYTLTKAVAEKLIETEGGELPIGIVRPSIVLATAKEPVSGWIDNFYGPTAVFLGVAMGIIRIVQCAGNCLVDSVPVDYLVNNVISAAWRVGATNDFNREPGVPVFNYVCSPENPIKWSKLPTYDLLNIYKKMKENIHTLSYFTIRQWTFVNKNTQHLWTSLSNEDKSLFPFNMNSFTWDSYIYSYVYGTRLYLLKEKIETLQQARRRLLRLKLVHYVVVTILLYLVYKIVTFVLNLIIA
ncbi:hypothetical protein RI129_012914 [Pyrocoelia pectoralis]|uniref:Fatty acyl-CoA reductase n=1 Tax=Pyrocoelia pectoralis TaxID=417401 RepID=A0AAN7V1N3_9COLE